MKKIPVADSVGMVLVHDLTRIVPGHFKGSAFKKGHVIEPRDIPVLLSMGKDHIFVWDPPEGHIHENEAALRIAGVVAGDGVDYGEPHEGKVSFKTRRDGLLRINRNGIDQINSVLNMCLSTLHDHTPVKNGKTVAATRVIPLTIAEEAVLEVEKLRTKHEWLIKVVPYQPLSVGVVITGNEVYYGRIKDAFGPTLKDKMEKYGCNITEQVYTPDEIEKITEAVLKMHHNGRRLIMVAGGMSVDPDDTTPGAIKNTGANIITYGSPVQPGAMFMLAMLGETIILGLPACVIYCKATIFDILLPRILAGQTVTRQDIVQLGVGGLCESCDSCSYPHCGFGRG
ncbi:MAG: hypothetical protein VR67_03080 [Peptococcaceae bacterium BRH_c8a]|nr:MAG: hypothetical protein VR67_03080 [Peptococcaceae bacterium BRH_c8a]